MNQLLREAVAVVLAVLAGGLLATTLVVLATDGEWGRVALLVGALALAGAARGLGRYDPERAAADARALPLSTAVRARAADLRNRVRSG